MAFLSSLSTRRAKATQLHCNVVLLSCRSFTDKILLAGYGVNLRAGVGSYHQRGYGGKGKIASKPKRNTGVYKVCIVLVMFTTFGAMTGKVCIEILDKISKGFEMYWWNEDDWNE